MTQPRKPSGEERAVIAALLQSQPELHLLLRSLDDVLVTEMDDGGMGSLSLVPKGSEGKPRSMGIQAVAGEFTDLDGVPVSVALNLDSEGKLYELDLWKVDFSALRRWPQPSAIRLTG